MRTPRPTKPADPSKGRGTVPPSKAVSGGSMMKKKAGPPGGYTKATVKSTTGIPPVKGLTPVARGGKSFGKVSPPGSSMGGAPRPRPGPGGGTPGPRKPR